MFKSIKVTHKKRMLSVCPKYLKYTPPLPDLYIMFLQMCLTTDKDVL